MRHYDDHDLGASVLIYIVAIVCGFAIFVVPVLLASGPTVIANHGARGAVTQINGARDDSRYPVAKLRRDAIVDPAITAVLSARNKATEVDRRRPARDGGISMSRRGGAAARQDRPESSYAGGQPVSHNTPGPFQKMYQTY